jgi:arylsulfatase A-like enzyme
VRDQRWKLIRYPQVNRTQLFDLQADPHELKDLSGEIGQAQHVEKMLALLSRAQRDAGDACPLTVANPKPSAWSPPAKSP